MLQDKEVAALPELMQEEVQKWYLATIADPRGMTAEMLVRAMGELFPAPPFRVCTAIKGAIRAAASNADRGDRVVIFGSFSVAEALKTMSL